jgi:hypothetical protein
MAVDTYTCTAYSRETGLCESLTGVKSCWCQSDHLQANVPHCDSELEGHDVLSTSRQIASHSRKLGARSLRFMHRRAAAVRPADTAGRACCLEP